MRIRVKNTSRKLVKRGGRLFPPLSTSELDVSEYRYREIKPCIWLSVEVMEEKPEQELEEAPETKQVEAEEDKEPDKDQEPKKEVENADEGFVCPHCDFVAKSETGLTLHIRAKHEEDEEAEEG